MTTTRFGSLRTHRRRGSTLVETALVLSVFSMLLFGIFEYCRFLYVMHVTNNAARDGARYAVVNMDKPSNFDTTDYTDATGATYPSVRRYTTERMGGTEKQLVGFKVAAFPVDPVGLSLSPPVIRPKSAGTTTPIQYPDPFNPSDPNRTAWNHSSFPDGIGVRIEGDYKPILPALLQMPSVIKVSVTGIAGSEG